MNQHVIFPPSACATDIPPGKPDGRLDLKPALRMIAARLNRHHGWVHECGDPAAPLGAAVILSTDRTTPPGLTLGDLCDAATLQSLARDCRPVFWSRGHAAEASSSPGTSETWRANRRHGISVAFHDAHGSHIVLTLADKAQPADTGDASLLAALAAPFLSAIAAMRMRDAPTLTPRENACLQWAAAGKTVFETSVILGLSAHTVAQHLASAASRLGAVNKTHAVAKAARAGLINLARL
jgi:DNA-binding CsgD family transcriptional regulator